MARSGSEAGGTLPGGTMAKARLLAICAAACLAGSLGLLTWLGRPSSEVRRPATGCSTAKTSWRPSTNSASPFVMRKRPARLPPLRAENEILAPTWNARGRIPQTQARLLRLTADDASQQTRLQGLAPLVERRMAELSDTVQARREVGADAALAIVGTDLGRQSMTAITAKLAELRAEEAGLLTRRRYAAEYAEVSRAGSPAAPAWPSRCLHWPAGCSPGERARARDLLATLDLGVFMARDPGGEIRFWSEGVRPPVRLDGGRGGRPSLPGAAPHRLPAAVGRGGGGAGA